MDVTVLKRKRYVYLFASAASFLVLGLVYAWSLFATPLATIYGWELSAVKVTFTICMAAFCVGGLIGAQVLKRLGVRGAILLSATLLAAGAAAIVVRAVCQTLAQRMGQRAAAKAKDDAREMERAFRERQK